MQDIKTKSDEELKAYQQLLEQEIEANEDENRGYQAELDAIYAEQDRRRGN